MTSTARPARYLPASRRSRIRMAGTVLCWCGAGRSVSAGLTGRSLTAPTARRHAGKERLIIGHESLGEVIEAPAGSGFAPGDLIVGIVRRPDPVPCAACAAGEWDMCQNDGFGERGIIRLHGYGSEDWRVQPDFAVPIVPKLGELGVLLEPGVGTGQGVGPGRPDLAARILPAGPGAGHRRRAHRPHGVPARRPARLRDARRRPRAGRRNATSWRISARGITRAMPATSMSTSTSLSSAPGSVRSATLRPGDWPAAGSCA